MVGGINVCGAKQEPASVLLRGLELKHMIVYEDMTYNFKNVKYKFSHLSRTSSPHYAFLGGTCRFNVV